MLKTARIFALAIGAFVLVGAIASSIALRGQVRAARRSFIAPDAAAAADASRVLSERARAMGAGGRVARCEVTSDGAEVIVEVHSRGGAMAFVERLIAPGVISFHEASPAHGPDGPLEVPPGFHAASFIDYLFSTTEDFGEKVENRTDLHLKDEPELTVMRLAGCRYHTEGLWREPVLTFEFAPDDAGAFEAVTRRLAGKMMAVCIDGKVRAAALVQGAVADGKAQMRGLRDNETALELAGVLAAGALPCKLIPRFGEAPSRAGPAAGGDEGAGHGR